MSSTGDPSKSNLPNLDTLINSLVSQIEGVFEVHSIRREVSVARYAPRAANRGTLLGRRLGVKTADGPDSTAAQSGGAALELTGQLRVDSDRAYQLIAERFRANGYLALLRKSAEGDLIVALPGELPQSRPRVSLALMLFLATLASVLYVGSTLWPQGDGVLGLLSAWPFAFSLLGILLAHEFGHYLVGRRMGISSSLPYFIPMPLSFLGTMGAVIRMKAPPRDRRALLALGASGPLAGFIVAVPLLMLGLELSSVETIPAGGMYVQEGNSLLYAALKTLVFGRFLPSGSEDVFLHPVAMAAWTGLLVTGLNLIPAGQLDGGHIAYALLGERARWLTWGVIVGLVGLSALWSGWLVWVALVLAFGQIHAVPLNDVTPLRNYERALVALLLMVFALVFTPIPWVFQ